MINNIIALGMEKPTPDRYINAKLINQLDSIKPTNGCNPDEHHVVFADYEINNDSSFFDMKPGICSCGLYWKTLANNGSNELKEYYIKTGRIPTNGKNI